MENPNRTKINRGYTKYIQIIKMRENLACSNNPKQCLCNYLERVKTTKDAELCLYFIQNFESQIDTTGLGEIILSSDNKDIIKAYNALESQN